MLDLIMQPAFCVSNGCIVRANQSALQRFFTVGLAVSDLITVGGEEYCNFEGGCLYLTLCTEGSTYGASVTRIEENDVFILEQQAENSELQAIALASRELREPLSNIMAVTDRLLPRIADREDPHLQLQIAQINQGLFQILRLISNMSDAGRYVSASALPKETGNISAIFEEILTSATVLIAQAGYTLQFKGLSSPVYGLVNRELLERAVYNLISNAVKFSPKDSIIKAKLTQTGSKLYFTVEDNGQGIARNQQGNLFSRFLRDPGIEDSRYGIGLGMVLVRSAATAHGGTVLMEQPKTGGTRITMSLAVKQSDTGVFSSQVLTFDYAGARDHGLIELSDILPAASYTDIN